LIFDWISRTPIKNPSIKNQKSSNPKMVRFLMKEKRSCSQGKIVFVIFAKKIIKNE